MSDVLPLTGMWLVLALLACGLGLALAGLEVDLATWELRRTTPSLEIRAGMWRGLVLLIAVGDLLSVIQSAPSAVNLTIVRVLVLAVTLMGSAVGYFLAGALWARVRNNITAQWQGTAVGLALGIVLLVAAYVAWSTPTNYYTALLSLQGTGDRALSTLISIVPRLPVGGAWVLGVASLLITVDAVLRLSSSRSTTRRSPGTLVLTFGSVVVAFLTIMVAVRLEHGASLPLTLISAAGLLIVVTAAYLADFIKARFRHPLNAGIALLSSAAAAACTPWAIPVLVGTAVVFAVSVLRLRRNRERRAVMADIVTSLGPVLALALVAVAGWLVSVFVVG